MFRIRIGDDAGSGLNEGLVLFHNDRPDINAHIHVAGETKVAHRTRIGTTSRGLKLIDNLHGSNLRRPGDGAGGKTSPQHVVGGLRLIQLSCHIRYDMHDMGISFHMHERIHCD